MTCSWCDEDHPRGVPADAIAAGHPYAVDRGFGYEYVRANPETGALERWSSATQAFTPDERSFSAVDVEVGKAVIGFLARIGAMVEPTATRSA